MFRFVGQAAEGSFQSDSVDRVQVRNTAIEHQRGESRTGSDGGGATAGQERDLGDPAVLDESGEPEDVAASGIRDFDGARGGREFAGVTGVAKMVEQLLAIVGTHAI